MTIKAGDKMPEGTFTRMTGDGPQKMTTDQLFAGKTVVLFSVPGAFTPTCDAKHLPGFVELAGQIKAKGVDTIACTAVNDVFVMNAWGKDQQVGDDVMMLADGNGEFTKAVGLEMDGSGFGMGMRSKRYSMIVEDGVVKSLNVEQGETERRRPTLAAAVKGVELLLGQFQADADEELAAFPFGQHQVLGDRVDQALELYLRSSSASAGNVWTAVDTDRIFLIPAVRLAEARWVGGGPTWFYLFKWASTALGSSIMLPNSRGLNSPAMPRSMNCRAAIPVSSMTSSPTATLRSR